MSKDESRLLSHEETMDLIIAAQKGDEVSKEYLVKHNIGLVKSVMRGFANRGYELDDLYQIGCIGLLKAIDNFDSSFDVKFSTYAVPMITGEIKRFLRDDGIIKVSRSLKQTAQRIRYAQESLLKILGREPSISEIAKELDMDKEEITLALEATYQPSYLHDVVHDNEGKPLHLIDKLDSEEDLEEESIDKILLQDLLSKLEARDRKVIVLRYFKDKTQVEVAKIMGISQVQVSRIEKRIIEYMKSILSKA